MSHVFNLMRNRLSRLGRRTRWTFAILAGTLALALLLSFLIDEPLHRSIEGQMNDRLTGYIVSIGKLRFHPIGLSLTLSDLVFTHQANPDPPVGRIARLDASVQWRALFSWKLVANFALDRPKLYVNLAHLRAEAADPEPVAKHGWQEALQAIVYDPVQDRDKSLVRKLYEKVVEGASKLLKSAPRKEVATVATISGPVEDVKAHTVEVVVKLFQNAFFKAILPGFDEQVRLTGRRK